MEAQLQTLIDKIKSDGIAEAEKQAEEIISVAQNKAGKQVEDSQREAERIINKAKAEAAQALESGRKALEHASRDLLLSLQKSIEKLFNNLLKREIGEALSPETVAAMLQKIAANWQAAGDLEVLVSEKDAEKLAGGLLERVKKTARQSLTLKPVESIDAGFKIGEKDGSLHYDFTESGLAEMLAQFVNPKLAGILKGN